jgi:hypothetical protein
MFVYIFIAICMLISCGGVWEAWKTNDVNATLGWFMALAFQVILFLRDMRGDEETPEVHKAIEKENKRIKAYHKLMNAGTSINDSGIGDSRE